MSDRGEWKCGNCVVRNSGACAALLGKLIYGPRLEERPDWQDHGHAPADKTILSPGDANDHVYVMCSGWASQSVRTPGGAERIRTFILPGELFSPASPAAERLDCSVTALTDIVYTRIRRDAAKKRLALKPAADESAAEGSPALDDRTAERRIARLLLDLIDRIEERLVVRDRLYPFPLSVGHIAGAAGLSEAQAGEALDRLAERAICRLADGVLEVDDRSGLERLGAAG